MCICVDAVCTELTGGHRVCRLHLTFFIFIFILTWKSVVPWSTVVTNIEFGLGVSEFGFRHGCLSCWLSFLLAESR